MKVARIKVLIETPEFGKQWEIYNVFYDDIIESALTLMFYNNWLDYVIIA